MIIKKLLQLTSNQKGLSALEVVIGSGLAIGLSAVVMKNMTNQNMEQIRNQQNLAIEMNLKQVSDTFKRKTDCDRIVGGMSPTQVDNIVVSNSNEESTNNDCSQPTSPEDLFPMCYGNGGMQGQQNGTDGGGQTNPIGGEECTSQIQAQLQQYINEEYPALMDEYTQCMAGNSGGTQDISEDGMQVLNLDFDSDLGSGLRLDHVNFNLNNGNTGTIGDVPLELDFDYVKRNPKNSQVDYNIKKQIVTVVTIKEDGTVECPGYETEQIESAGMESGCTLLGGVFQPDGSCDLSGGLNPVILDIIKNGTCQIISQGTGSIADNSLPLNQQLCDRILLGGSLQGQNISPTHINIDATQDTPDRVLFDTNPCGNGTWLNSVNRQGTKDCEGVVWQ